MITPRQFTVIYSDVTQAVGGILVMDRVRQQHGCTSNVEREGKPLLGGRRGVTTRDAHLCFSAFQPSWKAHACANCRLAWLHYCRPYLDRTPATYCQRSRAPSAWIHGVITTAVRRKVCLSRVVVPVSTVQQQQQWRWQDTLCAEKNKKINIRKYKTSTWKQSGCFDSRRIPRRRGREELAAVKTVAVFNGRHGHRVGRDPRTTRHADGSVGSDRRTDLARARRRRREGGWGSVGQSSTTITVRLTWSRTGTPLSVLAGARPVCSSSRRRRCARWECTAVTHRR